MKNVNVKYTNNSKQYTEINEDFKLSKTCDGYSVAFWMLRDSNGFLDFGVDFLIFPTFLILFFNNFQNKFWY